MAETSVADESKSNPPPSASAGPSKPGPTGSLPFPEYFTLLAENYGHFTGNSTRDLFRAALSDLIPPITSESTIHDNAAGPGTAASVIIDSIEEASKRDDSNNDDSSILSIIITDNVPAMIKQATTLFQPYHPKISAQILDSHDLSPLIPPNSLTHSILNFSIFTFADPTKCLREIYRSLKAGGGTAAIVTWKRFGVSAIIHAAQQKIRPDLPVMKIPGKEFMDEGYLFDRVQEVWKEEEEMMDPVAAESQTTSPKVTVHQKSLTLTGPDLEGVKDFILSNFTAPAKKGWSEEEVGKWPGAVDEALKEEIDVHGGLGMEAWVVIAVK